MSDLMRIQSNIQAMQARQSLFLINDKIGTHQMRLSTGKRINSSAEDPAGYHLSRSLERRRRGLDIALSNVSNAKNILNIAEGGYQEIMNILQTVKDKATQAADYSLNASQRTALDNQVQALIDEVDSIVNDTTFNNMGLIDGAYSGSFQTGEGSGDQLDVSLQDSDSSSLGLTSIDLTTAGSAGGAIDTIASAIDTLSGFIQDVGEFKVRLTSKEQSLSVQITNTESVRSNIEDADFASEQMEMVKLQILQQTATSALTQANSGPQVVLSLFG